MPTVSAKLTLLLCSASIALSALTGCQSLSTKSNEPAIEDLPVKEYSAAEKQQYNQQAMAIFAEYSDWRIEQSPVLASRLDYPEQFDWDDISLENRQNQNDQLQNFHQRLQTIEEPALDKQNKVSYQTLLNQVEFELLTFPLMHLQEPLIDRNNWLVISQDILLNHHPIQQVEDAHDYIDRVEALPQLFKRWQELLQWREQQGVISEKALLLKNQLRAQQYSDQYQKINVRNSELWQDFNRKLARLALYASSEKVLQNKLYKALTRKVQPSYQALANEFTRLAQIAPETIALNKQPQGMRYYQLLLAHHSESNRDANQLFQQLSQQLSDHQQQFIKLAETSGFNPVEPTKPENAQSQLKPALSWFADEAQRFESSDPDLSLKKRQGFQHQSLQQLAAELPYYLTDIPQQSLPLQSIYPADQRFLFQTMNSHDIETNNMMYGVPGQFIQYALAEENEQLPLFRRQAPVAEFNDGWRLMALQLAADNTQQLTDKRQLLMHQQIIDELALAITDVGIHGLNWTTDQAVMFMQQNSSVNEPEMQQQLHNVRHNPAIAVRSVSGYQNIELLIDKAKQRNADFDLSVLMTEWLKLGAVPAFSAEQYLLD